MDAKAFQFKKFSINQDRCAHKVGTDGVLLGAWANVSESDLSLLDIGTGSGLIAIMLAQRSATRAHIDALDIAADDVQQARENVLMSPWPEKVTVHHVALQDFFPEKQYDLIVSNPPFFVRSLLPLDEKRSQARHTLELSFRDLLANVSRLLKPQGKFAVIMPSIAAAGFITLAGTHSLFPLRKCIFRARANKPPERSLVEFSERPGKTSDENLILYDDASDRWSPSYRTLTSAFYLKA